MSIFPYGLLTKKITGRYGDTYLDPNNVHATRPREGYVYITPSINRIKILTDPANPVEIELYELKRQRVKMIDGQFEAELLVTNQPNVSVVDWTYNISPSWKHEAALNIPILLDDPDVIDLNLYSEVEESTGTVIVRVEHGEDGTDGTDGSDGISVVNIETVPDTSLARVTYSDGNTSDFQLPIIGAGGQTVKLQYVHNQNEPATEWYVQHNLGRRVSSVHVNFNTSPGDELVMCAWRTIDLNAIIIYVSDDAPGISQKFSAGTAIVA